MLNQYSRDPKTLRNYQQFSEKEKGNLGRFLEYVFDFLDHIPGAGEMVSDTTMQEWFTEDLLYIDPSRGGEVRGHDAFKEALEQVRTSFNKTEYSFHKLFPDNDAVTVEWSYVGHLSQNYPGLKSDSGVIRVMGITKIKFEGRKLKEIWQIFQEVQEEEAEVPANRFEPRSGDIQLPELTKREREVLHWICEGKTNEEIGIILGVSVRTTEKHCQNIYQKLGVENRRAAMLRGLVAGAS